MVESWQRCLTRHGLDPAAACEAVIVPQTRLKEHRQQSEELVHIARSGLERLYAQVAGQNYVLLLSDMKGVTVEFMGDPHFDHRLRRAGLYLGSEWLEERAGTCAIGACLATGEALTIHQDDHFDLTHTPLSCTAAPIYDGLGGLAAVLDISLLSSPTPKVSQNLALHLVTATARRIEMANLMASQRRNWVLRFSHSPEFLDVDPDAAIAVDADARICGMTHRGARLLGASIGQAGGALPGLIGERLDRFFPIGMDGLPDLTRDRPAHERLLRLRDGSVVFAHAIEPPTRWKSARPPAPPTMQPAASGLDAIGGNDARIDRMRAVARRLAPSTLPILLQGETGTGKEVLAAAIHAASGRQGRFIAINCAAIPEGLIEAELFGHAAGAFSGAGKARRGLVEEADGGTLFLDEIGDMPLALQTRLLRVLSEKVVQPVGTSDTRTVDIRVLSATNRNLSELVSAGRFRQDLLYRLNAAALDLPPLRDRADFDWLVARLLGPGGPRLSTGAKEALRRHDWPGNIRELANALAYAGAVADSGEIGLDDLPPSLVQAAAPCDAPCSAPEDEAQRLYATLTDTGWNISAASRRLGVDRTTMHRRMRRLGVTRPH